MKSLSIIVLLIVAACNNTNDDNIIGDTDSVNSSPAVKENSAENNPDQIGVDSKLKNPSLEKEKKITTDSALDMYSNQRFKEVRVKKLGAHRYQIQGKGQIFEASFGWVIEDGHDEIKKGYETTNAGAPDWGNFSFVVDVVKERKNSVLHLILFETSSKDGTRQFELPLFLY